MKDVLAYAAGAALIAYVGYIFISPDEPTRANRACIPAAAATKLLGSVVRLVDEDSGESLARGKPQQVLSACRTAVWYWAKDSRQPPKFPDDDALFGSYADKPHGNAATPPADNNANSTSELDKAVKAVKAIKKAKDTGDSL